MAWWRKQRVEATATSAATDRPSYGLLPHHGTPEERAELGKRIRSAVGRRRLGELGERGPGVDPVAILVEQAATRLPELIGLRYFRMLESPFAFLRGSAAVMSADLAALPRTGLEVQLCGDAHLANFGVFKSPERELVFDLNDFDETHVGSFEWDVKRLVISGAVAAKDLGFSDAQAERAARAGAQRYRETMQRLAGLGNLEVFYAFEPVSEIRELVAETVGQGMAKDIDAIAARAMRKDTARAVGKLTELVDGELRFTSDPPVLVPLREITGEGMEAMRHRVEQMVGRYRESLPEDRQTLLEQYEVVDVARKVVGVGSVGTRCFVALLQGRDQDDQLVLQIKQAEASVLERYLGPSRFASHGQRVVVGQRAIQATPDVFLGWYRGQGLREELTDVYVRQLWDGKGSVNFAKLNPERLTVYMAVCGGTLARAHARTGDRIAIAAYLGSSDAFDRSMGRLAMDGVERNQADYDRLVAAAEDGLIPVTVER